MTPPNAKASQSNPAPSISDYALIGDCRTAALVSSDGSIDWLCLPNFPSSSVFGRLLDADAGSFSLCPTDAFEVTRRYIDETAVLETTFTTRHGCAKVIDCLPAVDGIVSMRPLRELLRVVEGVSGIVSFQSRISPRPDYGRLNVSPKNRGRLGWSYVWGNKILHILSDVEFLTETSDLLAEFSVSAGDRRHLSLSYHDGEIAVIAPVGREANERLADTIDWWRKWSSQIIYDGPYRAEVVRSAVSLKLMTFVLSGAVVAAPTTSLPEEIGASKNWDYRFCWLRDAGLTMEAMLGVGVTEDAEAFLKWMLHATRLTWPKLQIMYDVYGRTNLTETELPHLAGYRQSKPVRIGNGAFDQLQLDVYGEVIHAAATYVAAGGIIDKAGGVMLAGLGSVVCKTWREPDHGIWEKRGERFDYTFSKVMCWVALDRLIDMHDHGVVSLGSEVAVYRQERAAIEASVESRGYNKQIGAYTKVFDGKLLDASILLMSSVGYRAAHDERVTSTLSRITERLSEKGLMRRYEPEPDDRGGGEGTFVICSFWAIEQIARQGDLAEAERQFIHLLSFANDVGLLAEEIDGKSGEALGNFPQAFSHVGLINAAIAIEHARRSVKAEGHAI